MIGWVYNELSNIKFLYKFVRKVLGSFKFRMREGI